MFLLAAIATGFLCAASGSLSAQTYKAEWEDLSRHEVAPEWFKDAKLGVYFHWGVYSVPAWGTEWYPKWMYVPDRDPKLWGGTIYKYHRETYGENFHYHDFIPMWKAPNFNAERWVDVFEGMGAKFIGTIAEHHDGFSLWDSQVNPWNSVDMGPRINVVDSIAKEVKKRGLKFMTTFHHGVNHTFFPRKKGGYDSPLLEESSKYEYDNVEVPSDPKYRKLYGLMPYAEANQYWLDKLNEVVDAYCPDYVWMDYGPRYIDEAARKEFLRHYFNVAQKQGKDVVVNTKGTFFPTDIAVVNVERATMEDITKEVWITDFILGGAWCYNRAKRVAIKPDYAIKMLAEVVSKNGVMLLSAGPTADGTIPEEQVQSMVKIGEWMKRYGEAIYETRPFVSYGQGTTVLKRDPADAWNEYGAIKKGFDKLCASDIRYTRKGNTVYAIQLGWSDKGISHLLTAFEKQSGFTVKHVELLGSPEKVEWKQSDKGLSIEQPSFKPAEADAAIVYKITL